MAENDHKYHKPDDSVIDNIQEIRKGTIALEKTFEKHCKDERSLYAAEIFLETARMWAIKGVVMDQPVEER